MTKQKFRHYFSFLTCLTDRWKKAKISSDFLDRFVVYFDQRLGAANSKEKKAQFFGNKTVNQRSGAN